VLVQPGELLAAGQVRFAARDIVHVRRVAHAHLDPGPGQRVIDRPPVHPVLSIAASVTPSCDSQAASVRSDRQDVLNLRTVTVRSPGRSPGSRAAT